MPGKKKKARKATRKRSSKSQTRKHKVIRKKKSHRRIKSSLKGNLTKSKTHTDNNKFRNVDISIGAINHHIKQARIGLEQKLSGKMLQAYKTKGKAKKKAITKQIRELKTQIIKLS